MTTHPVLWASPQPLWGRFKLANGDKDTSFRAADQARPALLRFTSDEFMQQLLAILAADPRQLSGLLAHPETWRNPSGETPDLVERVPLPRLARALKRLRSGASVAPPVDATTAEVETT